MANTIVMFLKISNKTFIKVFVYFLGFSLLYACSAQPDRQETVGRIFKSYKDVSRQSWLTEGDRPINTIVWYPADNAFSEEAWEIGVFTAGWSAPNAPIKKGLDKRPLVILSHGTGGAAAQLSWLAETLVNNGFIVAAVNHHGNTAAEEHYSKNGFALWWERAKDISVAIDKLLGDEHFSRFIDPERIGAAGFSLGSYSVLTAIGAKTSLDQFNDYCSQHKSEIECALPPEIQQLNVSFKELIRTQNAASEPYQNKAGMIQHQDTRIKSAYLLAPVHTPALDTQSLNSINIPITIVVGNSDSQSRLTTNANILKEQITNSKLEVLDEVGHYTFLVPCGFKGKMVLAELCSDRSDIERKEIHKKVSEDAANFFKNHWGCIRLAGVLPCYDEAKSL